MMVCLVNAPGFCLAIVIGIWSGFKFSRLWGLAAYDGTDG